MKKAIIFTTSLLVVFSCGQPSDIDTLKQEKTKLKGEISSLEAELEKIEEKILALDTTKAEVFPDVTIAIVEQKPFAEKVTFQGTVEADKNVLVSPQSSGVIRGIFVKEGQKVSAGKTLASLDSDILNRNVAEVEKALELANYMFEKQLKLKEQGVGVELQYEQAKNQKESLERKLATLGTQASKSRVTSPITGYVDDILPKVGEMANPGMPMFRVINLNKVTVKADISENYLSEIKQGSSVEIYFPSIDYTIKDINITRSGKFINPNNRTYDIQVDLDNKEQTILPNLLAEVRVTKKFTDNAIVIPSKSVLEDNKGKKYVYLYNNGIAQKKSVIVDFVNGDNTQISEKSGLTKGDQVIVDGVTAIVDGERVNIHKQENK